MALRFKCSKCKEVFEQDFESCPVCKEKETLKLLLGGTFKERYKYITEKEQSKQEKTREEKNAKIPAHINKSLYFHCKKCDYYSNDGFEACPKCGSKDYFWNHEIRGDPDLVQAYIKKRESERKEIARLDAQRRYEEKLTCPRCHTGNVSVAPITETSGSVGSNGIGCLGWLFWLALVPFTAGFILIVPLILSVRTKGKVTSKTYNRATCQKCGYWWKS